MLQVEATYRSKSAQVKYNPRDIRLDLRPVLLSLKQKDLPNQDYPQKAAFEPIKGIELVKPTRDSEGER